MKKIFIPLFAIVVFTACENATTKQASKSETVTKSEPMFFGEKIVADGAIASDSLVALMGDKKEMECKLTGKVDAVCQKKGCWMELKNIDGSALRVTFKDYAFFMPKDGSGKTAIVEGVAKVEVTSIADLQEYAKDDGKSKEEIAKITKPEQELVFEAKGVILQ